MLLGEPLLLGVLLLALALDGLFGDPDAIWKRLPHPAVLFGRLIGRVDTQYNDPGSDDGTRRERGFAFVTILCAVTLFLGHAVEVILLALPFGTLLLAALASTLIAQKSLFEHVREVARALDRGGVEGGREAVRHIVGRDPESLDEAGISRASIESCAENFSDGVVAPVFWFVVFGFGGLLAYKAVNTADSMIGHRTPRHEAFGWAAARLDDLLNWVPARLSGALIAGASGLAGGKPEIAFKVMVEDASKHRSPNAGWPEAAMAAALGVALAGPRTYGDETVNDAWMNEKGRNAATASDIRRGLKIFIGACLLNAGLIGFLWVLL